MENEFNLEGLVRADAEGKDANDALKFLNDLGASGNQQNQDALPAPTLAPPIKKKKEPVIPAAPIQKPVERPTTEAADPDAGQILDQIESETGFSPDNLPPPTPQVNTAPQPMRLVSGAKAVAGDLAEGAVEAPLQVAGGIADAFNAFVGLGDILQEKYPLPGLRIFDTEGNFDPAFVSAEEVNAEMKARDGKPPTMVPTTDRGDTVTGAAVRGTAQFLAGMALTRGSSPTALYARGMFSDIAAFDGHEARLSNLIQSNPNLANPITEYLASDKDDTEAEGRFKNALEGVATNVIASALLSGVKAIKRARAVKGATGAPTYTQAADAMANHVKATGELPTGGGDPLASLGNAAPDAPLVIKQKLADAAKATEIPVPDDVAVKGLANAARIADSDVYINFAKINSGDDVKAVMRDVADALKGDVSAAQRGVRTNAQTAAAASSKYDEVWKEMLERRTGDLTLNAEQQLAMRRIWTASGEKLLQSARLAEASPTAENLIAFRKMLTVHKVVQDQALAVRTETARALQQWNIPAGVGGRDKINAMQNLLVQHGGNDVTIDLARRFAGLADEVAANPNNMAKVAKLAEKTAGATKLKAINEAWIGISLLSGPKTHLRNLISNTGMMATSVAERAVASRSLGLLDERTAIEVGEASSQVAGIFGNVKQAWLDAVDTFKTGQMKEGLSQIDIPPEMAMRSLDQNTLFGKTMNALSYVASPVFKGLQASDQFMKTLNYSGEIRALATRDAMQAVRNGAITADEIADHIAKFVANPPQQAVTDALEKSALRTFTNEPGKLTKSLLRLRSEYPALRFVIPFVNTPANVFRTAVEYSPMAPVLSRYRDAIAKGGPEAILARTRLGMGTTAMLAFVDMAMEGKITGSGPQPQSPEYDALKRTGWSPYTVRIGDKWVNYRGVEPFSTIMGVGADIGDYVRYSSNNADTIEEIKDALAVGVFAAADNMLNRSFLSGMSDIIGAVIDPQRNGSKFMDGFASSFIPRGLVEVRNVVDPTVRDARTIMDAFKNKIPYLSMAVPEKRDAWGREKSMESGWGKAYDVLSPFYASQMKVEPIDKELLSQGFDLGDTARSFVTDRQRVSLANGADIYNRFLEIRGQEMPSAMNVPQKVRSKLVSKYGDYKMLDLLNAIVTGDHPLSMKYVTQSDGRDGGKHNMLRSIVTEYGKAARLQLREEYPEISDDAEGLKTRKEMRAIEGQKMFDEMLAQ